MKNIHFLVTILSFAISGSVSAMADIKIGTVDLQQALQTVDQGKSAKSKLESEVSKKKSELQKEEEKIKKLHAEFEKQSMVLTDQARAKKQAEIQGMIMKYQETVAKTQMEMQKKEKDLTDPIITGLRKIIASLAEERGYTMVLEKNENTVLFSQEKDDLTQEVIKQYNKKN